MIDRPTYLANLSLARTVANVGGCVVECGVWRGGMIAGIAEVLGQGREYFLFDSFQGLPPAREIDGRAALAWQANTTSPIYYDNCSAPIQTAQEAMSLSRATSVHIIPGWFNETLKTFRPPHPIAILRLDGDWYESTIMCLSCLVPHVATGGIVIVDDYYTWDGCTKAVHDYVAKSQSLLRIRQFQDRVCFLSVEEKCQTPDHVERDDGR